METDHDRIIRLEGQYESLDGKVTEIRDNHLVHLLAAVNENSRKIDAVQVRLAVWSGAVIILGVLAPYVLNKLIG